VGFLTKKARWTHHVEKLGEGYEGFMSWIERNITSQHLFLSAPILIPAFVLQDLVLLKALQTLIFMVFCGLSGRKVGPIRSLFLLGVITVFHLFNPAGKVLWQAGPLAVTSLSLETGLFRGLTVVGLFAISRFCIRQDLKVPGMLGRLISRIFYYYNLLLQSASLNPRNLSGSLDDLMLKSHRSGRLELHGTATGEAAPRESVATTSWIGFTVLLALIASNWCLTLLGLSSIVVEDPVLGSF
jgi:heptaprenyl diphosphate synthase